MLQNYLLGSELWKTLCEMRTFLLDKSQFWVIFHVVASGGLIQPQRWWQKSRGYHWKTRENENKTQVWTEFNSPSDNEVLHLCVVPCHGRTQSLTPVILKDLKMNKTGRREIHSEADRHGDMQFLSGEINLLNFLWHLHLVSEFFTLFLHTPRTQPHIFCGGTSKLERNHW